MTHDDSLTPDSLTQVSDHFFSMIVRVSLTWLACASLIRSTFHGDGASVGVWGVPVSSVRECTSETKGKIGLSYAIRKQEKDVDLYMKIIATLATLE